MGKTLQSMVVVEMFKRFAYPKSMLNKFDCINDAIGKAHNDMQTMVNEIMNDDHHEIQVNMFEYRVDEERGYKFRKPELDRDLDRDEVVEIDRAAKHLSIRAIETKYGQLSPEVNPHLYDHIEPEVKDELGFVIRGEVRYIRQDIESEMWDLYQNFRDGLYGAQKRK